MNARFITAPEVVRPTPEPLTSSVLDHATVRDIDHFGLRNNEGLWPSYNCLDLHNYAEICPDTMSAPKVFTRAEWQSAFEFALYGGAECLAVGLDIDDQHAEVKRVFALTEGRAVERALVDLRFTDLGSDVPWNLPEDLTPSTPVNLVLSLALLEGDAAASYAGLPTIHMPRAAATVLESHGLIVWTDGKAYTKNGSKVAIGGGYDDPAMLATGLWTLYATGEVYVERSDIVDVQSYVVPGDGSGTGSDENGLSDNAVVTLNERMYRVAVDCYASQIDARMWS